MNEKAKKLLFEIGVEEVPARFLPGAMEALAAAAKKCFDEAGVSFSGIETFATPRRIAILVSGLPEVQPDRVREIFGPPQKTAFDKDGNPTTALTGFAASLGVGPEELVAREKSQKQKSGLYMAALIREKGNALKDVLPKMLREILLSLSFPKSMRWGDGSLRFVRPIRWITAIFGSDALPFEIDGVRSGDVTGGHRFLSPGFSRMKDAGSYEAHLKTCFVIASPARRREMVLEDLSRLAGSVGGRPVFNQGLLDTVINLVEYPVGMLCEFPREYLDLPEELLVTVMRDHQKYFAVRDESGRLTNYFIVIANTLKENYFVVKAGAERVIRARFEDARFYYQEDRNRSLAERFSELEKVVFHERLGSLADKVTRVRALTAWIAGAVCPESEKTLAERAALLSKCDLVTGVVREFPELQGIMGGCYAQNDGEPEEVAQAIIEQYLPRHAGDSLPETCPGTVLALADRLDNIVSFFHLGLAPTGSEDPFALRRQAAACVLVLIERGFELTISGLVGKAAGLLGQNGDLKTQVISFFESRLPQIFEAKGLVESDITEALMPLAARLPIKELIERGGILRLMRQLPDWGPFLLAIKRVKNILPRDKKQKLPPADLGLLVEPAEKELAHGLFALEASVREKQKTKIPARNFFESSLREFFAFTTAINAFFDAVLVMDKDPRIRQNRLSLLSGIWDLASEFCDFSKLS